MTLVGRSKPDLSHESGKRHLLRIAIPDLISNSYFPAIAAVDMGFFKKYGIAATYELVAPVERAYAALRDGEFDIVAGSAHSALSAFPTWKGVKLLCAQAQGTYWFLVMRSSLGLTRGDLTKLRNVRIGAAPWVGLTFKHLIAEAGIDIAQNNIDISPVPSTVNSNVNFGVAAAEALAAGTIDGFWANGMGAEVAVQRGVGTVILDVRRGDGPVGCYDYTLSCIAATERLIESRPDIAEVTVRAVMGAQAALKADPEAAYTVARTFFPETEASLIAELIRRDLPYYEPTISTEAVDGMNKFARSIGILSGNPTYHDVVAEQVMHLWHQRDN